MLAKYATNKRAVLILAVTFSLLAAVTVRLGPAVTVLFHSAVVCAGTPPLSNVAWNCSSDATAAGTSCSGLCSQGYASATGGPLTALCSSRGVWGTPVGTCDKVCAGLPPLSLLRGNGVWPSSCDGRSNCTAVCTNGAQGSPRMQCGDSGWRNYSMIGRCHMGPVCLGVPALKLPHGLFLRQCADMPAGQNCKGLCHRGFGGGPPPTLACEADPSSSSGASWAAAPVGGCHEVCDGLPPADLLKGLGSWLLSCDNATAIHSHCNASCNAGLYGSASIMCTAFGWRLDTFVGGCSNTPVCKGIPKAPLPNGNFTARCASSPVNSSCEGVCLPAYGGPVKPVIACLHDPASPDKASWAPVAETNGTCIPLCVGAPPAELLLDGTWASCAGSSLPGRVCNATCNNFGAASIACGTYGSWNRSSFHGQCRKTNVTQQDGPAPVCAEAPPALFNGYFIEGACAGAEVGEECLAMCNGGFGAGEQPTTMCQLPDWSDTPQWSLPQPRLCVKSRITNGTAFIVDEDANAVYICSMQDGRIHECNASDAAVGDTAQQPLNEPLGIAVQGQHVWISDKEEVTHSARVRVCTWSGHRLTACHAQTIVMSGAGQIAVDTSRDFLYHVLNDRACVMACKGIYTLEQECECTEFPLLHNGFPNGVAVGFGRLWVAALAGVLQCPLDDSPSGFNYKECVATNMTDAAGRVFVPLRVLVDNISGAVLMSDGLSTVIACSQDLTGCVTASGASSNGSTAERLLPFLSGMALGGRFLYVPLPPAGSHDPVVMPALSVCSKRVAPGSACSLVVPTTDPPLAFSGIVSVVIVLHERL